MARIVKKEHKKPFEINVGTQYVDMYVWIKQFSAVL
jgi:hypothetical protein